MLACYAYHKAYFFLPVVAAASAGSAGRDAAAASPCAEGTANVAAADVVAVTTVFVAHGQQPED